MCDECILPKNDTRPRLRNLPVSALPLSAIAELLFHIGQFMVNFRQPYLFTVDFVAEKKPLSS